MSPAPRAPELLAPAGERAAAYAAFAFGADAIYTGLPRFSARAGAVNLSPRELEEIIAYAHALPRPRRVYVTLNTLLYNAELPDLTLVIGEEDAVYVIGQVPAVSVDAEVVDRLLGSTWAVVERLFRPAMRIGFGSRFRA